MYVHDGDTRTTRRSKRVRDVRNERITSSPLSQSPQIPRFIRSDRLLVDLRERKRRGTFSYRFIEHHHVELNILNEESFVDLARVCSCSNAPAAVSHSLGRSTAGGGWLEGKVAIHHRNSRKSSRTPRSRLIELLLARRFCNAGE